MRSTVCRFNRDQRGVTALLFAFLLFPILMMAGSAIDYSRVATARADLQDALDAAALTIAKGGPSQAAGSLALANAVLKANLPLDAYDNFAVTSVDWSDKTLTVVATGSVEASFTKVAGYDNLDVTASSVVAWGDRKIELTLVLDNTGSMGSAGKMQALKDASNALVDVLEDASVVDGDVKLAVIPFDTQVRVPNSFDAAPWLRYDNNPLPFDYRLGSFQGGVWVDDYSSWDGCIADRDNPFHKNGAPYESGQFKSRFPAAKCKQSGLARALPLTSNFAAVRSTIATMSPSGCTNLSIGVSWGDEALSPQAPFTGAKPYTDATVEKVMIVLTDGRNTRSRYGGSCGLSGPPPAGNGVINAATRDACSAVKAKGVRVYTVRVINGNAGILRNCASDPSMYFDVQNVGQLTDVFEQIAQEVARLRISS